MHLHLSFRVHSIGWRGGILLNIFATVGLMLPLVYGAWYVFGSGVRVERRHRLENLTSGNAVMDAHDAIQRGNLQMVIIQGEVSASVPGFRKASDEYGQYIGYRSVYLIEAEDLTGKELRLNELAKGYAESYNKTIVRQLPTRAQELARR